MEWYRAAVMARESNLRPWPNHFDDDDDDDDAGWPSPALPPRVERGRAWRPRRKAQRPPEAILFSIITLYWLWMN